jgi:hypothetical protein
MPFKLDDCIVLREVGIYREPTRNPRETTHRGWWLDHMVTSLTVCGGTWGKP